MLQYHFFQTDSEGRFLHGASFLFPNDEAALAKAREYSEDCNVEVWRDQLRLAVIFGAEPEQTPLFDPARAIAIC